MTKVMADISMSLDGFIAGPDDTFEQPLGAGGDRLHEWVYDLASWRQQHGMEGGEGGQDSEIIAEGIANIGAVVIGRRMFDLAEEPWGDEPPFRVPVFVVTHRPRETLEKAGGTTFHFVTDGIESAVEQAKAAARTSSSSSYRRGCSMSSRFTSFPSSSAAAVACSTRSALSRSSWKSTAWSRLPASRTSATDESSDDRRDWLVADWPTARPVVQRITSSARPRGRRRDRR